MSLAARRRGTSARVPTSRSYRDHARRTSERSKLLSTSPRFDARKTRNTHEFEGVTSVRRGSTPGNDSAFVPFTPAECQPRRNPAAAGARKILISRSRNAPARYDTIGRDDTRIITTTTTTTRSVALPVTVRSRKRPSAISLRLILSARLGPLGRLSRPIDRGTHCAQRPTRSPIANVVPRLSRRHGVIASTSAIIDIPRARFARNSRAIPGIAK